jgi:hypothetical protein
MAVMTRDPIRAQAALALVLAGGLLLSACGSSTNTVTDESPPAPQTTTSATQPSTTTTSAAATTTTPASSTTPTSTAGGTAAPGANHTAPEPAFTKQETHAEDLDEAVAVLKGRGYTPNETAQYHADQTLRVLVGTRTGSSDGYGQQAFFFVDGRYIGTDTKEASATVTVVSQGETEVTLAYPLYRKSDPLSSPSGGRATVRFQLDNGKLTALDPIPPASSATGLSRN